MTILTRMTDLRKCDGSWSVAEAKARFSQLVEQAQSKGPQTITKHGVVTAVLVSAQEWNRKTKRTGNLAAFFANSPLRNSGMKIARKKDRSRKVDV
jgi:prevent-host-death family protein